jgi:hypothetical protein
MFGMLSSAYMLALSQYRLHRGYPLFCCTFLPHEKSSKDQRT